STSGGTTATVFTNDTINGAAVNSSIVSVSLTNLGGLTGPTIAAQGIISVPSAITPGTYTVTYQICDATNGAICDSATVQIQVNGTIDAVNDNFTATPIVSATGGTT